VGQFLLRTVEEQLLSRYGIDITDNAVVRGALHSELSRFRKSPTGQAFADDPQRFRDEELRYITQITVDRHDYFARVLYHLRFGRKKSVAIFLDNLDRRDDKIQEEAFLRASAIARDWACPVFVCLRPGTFWRSKKDGVLDSVAPRLISISSPKVGPLLKRRLEFAARMARGDVPFVGRDGAASQAISVHLPKVAALLDCAAESFFRNAELREMIAAFSNGNVRELLRLVQQILTSRHLNATMEVLFKKGCCESEVAGQEWSDNPTRVRISPLGRYHVNILLETFNYYDAVVVDTPIVDDRVRSVIADVFPIGERLNRGAAFVRYLADASDSVQDADGKRFIETKLDAAQREIERIQADLPR